MLKTRTPGWYNGLISVCGLAAALTCVPDHLHAQSLDEAVIEQLRTIVGKPCSTLIGPDPNSVLVGELATICARTVGGGSPSTSAGSAGGGTATPTRLPPVVQQRLKNDNDTTAKNSTATSADTVINLSENLSLFGSLEYASLDRDVTARQDGFDSSLIRLTGGIDNQITDAILAGLGFTLRNHTGDFNGGGDFQTDAIALLAYASFTPVEQLFVQVSGGYSSENHARNRKATFTAAESIPFSTTGITSSDFDASEYSLGTLFGYDMTFSNVTVGPRAGINLVLQDFDSYSEGGTTGLELQFDGSYRTSLQSILGLMASATLGTSFGVVVPQASVNWTHEFEDDSRTMNVSFVDDTRSNKFTYQNDGPDRNFFEINIGSALVLPFQVQAFVNYRALLGHAFLDSHTGTIGLRKAL